MAEIQRGFSCWNIKLNVISRFIFYILYKDTYVRQDTILYIQVITRIIEIYSKLRLSGRCSLETYISMSLETCLTNTLEIYIRYTWETKVSVRWSNWERMLPDINSENENLVVMLYVKG